MGKIEMHPKYTRIAQTMKPITTHTPVVRDSLKDYPHFIALERKSRSELKLLLCDIPDNIVFTLHQAVFKLPCLKMMQFHIVRKRPEKRNSSAYKDRNLRND